MASQRGTLKDALGLERFSADGHLDPKLGSIAPEKTVPVTLWAQRSEIPSYFVRPAPERDTGAAVVLVAGHGRGAIDMVEGEPSMALRVARAGLTVLVPEMLSFGERRTARRPGKPAYRPEESSCDIDAPRYLMNGSTVLGRRVGDAAAAVHALQALPGIDSRRVGVAGASGGGAIALMLAATTHDVRAALVASYFATFDQSICAIAHCPCNIIPGILPGLEMADVAALVAPRGLVLEAGEHDPLFPIRATRSEFGRLAELWAKGKHRDAPAPELVVTDGGHGFEAGRSLDLFAARLAA